MTKSVLCAVDISNGDHDASVLKQAARLADLDRGAVGRGDGAARFRGTLGLGVL